MLSTKQTFPLFVFMLFLSTTSKKCVFIYMVDYTAMMTLSLRAWMCVCLCVCILGSATNSLSGCRKVQQAVK